MDIYQYVGDEVIVSWLISPGLKIRIVSVSFLNFGKSC